MPFQNLRLLGRFSKMGVQVWLGSREGENWRPRIRVEESGRVHGMGEFGWGAASASGPRGMMEDLFLFTLRPVCVATWSKVWIALGRSAGDGR